jgi:hypothetical protein
MTMISDITMEKTLLDEPAGVILEDRSGKRTVKKVWEDMDVRIEQECGDEIFPAMAWI